MFGVLGDLESILNNRFAEHYAKDAAGHDHKPAGPGGGQFTGDESGGSSLPDDVVKLVATWKRRQRTPEAVKNNVEKLLPHLNEQQQQELHAAVAELGEAKKQREAEHEAKIAPWKAENERRHQAMRSVHEELSRRFGSPASSDRSEAAYYRAAPKIGIRVASHEPIHGASVMAINVVTGGHTHPSWFHPDTIVIDATTPGKTAEQILSEIDAAVEAKKQEIAEAEHYARKESPGQRHLFNEDDHPRGQPDNAGQFIEKGEAPAEKEELPQLVSGPNWREESQDEGRKKFPTGYRQVADLLKKDPVDLDALERHVRDRIGPEGAAWLSGELADAKEHAPHNASADAVRASVLMGAFDTELDRPGADRNIVNASVWNAWDQHLASTKNWKALERKADEAKDHGDYETAAKTYEEAYKAHPGGEYDTEAGRQKRRFAEAARRAKGIGERQPLPPVEQRKKPRDVDTKPPADAADLLTLTDAYEKEKQIKPGSSRTTPREDHGIPLGTWRIDDKFRGIHGRQVEQLREFDPNALGFNEDMAMTNEEGRADDAERYKEWRKQGKRPPPISVIETESGQMRIIDGHRRARAAQLAGEPIEAWVSPTVETGVTYPDGKKAKTGLTWEMVKKERGDWDKADKWHDPEKPPSDLKAPAKKSDDRPIVQTPDGKEGRDTGEQFQGRRKIVGENGESLGFHHAHELTPPGAKPPEEDRPLKKAMHHELERNASKGDKAAARELELREADTRRHEDPEEIAKHFGGSVPSREQLGRWMGGKEPDPHPDKSKKGETPTDESMEHFYFLHGADQMHRKENAKRILKEAGESTAVEFTRTHSDSAIGKIIVHPSAKIPGTWQLSEVGRDGKAWGDQNFKTRESALRSIAGEHVEWGTYGQPGEWEITGKAGGPKPATPKIDAELGYGGMREGFKISGEGGARVTGYVNNADFPGKPGSPTRGELFYIEVPKEQRGKGAGGTLAVKSLRLMQEHGAETVNISTTTKEGRQLVDSLIKNGHISEAIATSDSGKQEYKILGGREFSLARETVPKPPEKPEPPPAYREYAEAISKAGLTPRPFEQWDSDRKETLAKQRQAAAAASDKPAETPKVGDRKAVGGIGESTLRRHEQADGVSYQLWENDQGEHYLHVFDADSGQMVEGRRYGKDASAAHKELDKINPKPADLGRAQALERKHGLSAVEAAIFNHALDTAEYDKFGNPAEAIQKRALQIAAKQAQNSDWGRLGDLKLARAIAEEHRPADPLRAKYDEYTQAMRGAKIEPRPFGDWKSGLKPVEKSPTEKPAIAAESGDAGRFTKPVKENRPAPPKTDNAEGKAKSSHAKTAAKLRETAASMAEAAGADLSLSRDRLSNTRKRAEQAGHAISDAMSRQAQAATLRNLADHLEAGNAEHLRGLKNRMQMEALDEGLRAGRREFMREKTYYEQEQAKGRPFTEEEAAAAKYPNPTVYGEPLRRVLAAVKGKPGTGKAADRFARVRSDDLTKLYGQDDLDALDSLIVAGEKYGPKFGNDSIKYELQRLKDSRATHNRLASAGITPANFNAALEEYRQLKSYGEREPAWKKLERGLVGRKIPGFFPTPRPVISKMLDKADVREGMSVLEPSAGKGDILDALKARHPEAKAHALEISSDLRAIVEGKGHTVEGGDFLEHGEKYDRIIANPPFENHQDIDHTRHAYDLLKPGGRLVSVMSVGPFQREHSKDREFREWFEARGGEMEKLPAGSFSGHDAFRQTGVSTVLVTLDKPG